MNFFEPKGARCLGRLIAGLAFVLLIAGCGGDRSEVNTGGGSSGVNSDGGSLSARFAGSYLGMITTNLTSDSFDDQTDVDDLLIVVRTDGTATLSIDGEEVEGVINDNQLGFSIQIIEERDLLECEGTAIITATINGSSLSGDTQGSGGCDLGLVSSGLRITGTLSATKQ